MLKIGYAIVVGACLVAGSAYADCQIARVAADVKLTQPVEGVIAPTGGFGMRTHPVLGTIRMHPGLDFEAPNGTPVAAAAAGEVVQAERIGEYGLAVMVRHAVGLETFYTHLSKFAVKPGDCVTAGGLLGWTGSTGLSSSAHLHFEVHRGGAPVDPAPLLAHLSK